MVSIEQIQMNWEDNVIRKRSGGSIKDWRTLGEEGDTRGFCNRNTHGEDFLGVQEKSLQISLRDKRVWWCLRTFEDLDMKILAERCGVGGYSALLPDSRRFEKEGEPGWRSHKAPPLDKSYMWLKTAYRQRISLPRGIHPQSFVLCWGQ